MTPKDSDTKLFQKSPNLGSKPKHDTQHSENTRKQRKKWRKIEQVQEKITLLNLAPFHEDQWARYGWNPKGVRTRYLRIKFSDGPKHQILTREIKNTENESEIEHAYIQSDSSRQPCGPLMSTTNNNNKQHPKTSRKSRNNSMIAEKNWKHMPVMLEITPLQQCWLGFKLFSKAAHLQTRFSLLSYLQKNLF